MPTAFEEITIGYKIASLIFEVGRASTNTLKSRFAKSSYRVISSLTTLEFSFEGNDQVTSWVQDRTVKITRDETHFPPFTFGTDGQDSIEAVLINGSPVPHELIEKDPQRGMIVGPRERYIYNKNDILRCTMQAKSVNGFTKSSERFEMTVTKQMDSATVFLIFPSERLPKTLRALYHKGTDSSVDWRDVKREKNELRQFTGGRKAFILEALNPPIGHEYRIAWDW